MLVRGDRGVALLLGLAVALVGCDASATEGNVNAGLPRTMGQVTDVRYGCEVGIGIPEEGTRRSGYADDLLFERSDIMSCDRAVRTAQANADRGARAYPVAGVIYAYTSSADQKRHLGVLFVAQFHEGSQARVLRTAGTHIWSVPGALRAAGDFDPRDPRIGATFEVATHPLDPEWSRVVPR